MVPPQAADGGSRRWCMRGAYAKDRGVIHCRVGSDSMCTTPNDYGLHNWQVVIAVDEHGEPQLGHERNGHITVTNSTLKQQKQSPR
jgi:hypothetical protein